MDNWHRRESEIFLCHKIVFVFAHDLDAGVSWLRKYGMCLRAMINLCCHDRNMALLMVRLAFFRSLAGTNWYSLILEFQFSHSGESINLKWKFDAADELLAAAYNAAEEVTRDEKQPKRVVKGKDFLRLLSRLVIGRAKMRNVSRMLNLLSTSSNEKKRSFYVFIARITASRSVKTKSCCSS